MLNEEFGDGSVEIMNIGDSKRQRRIIEGTEEARAIMISAEAMRIPNYVMMLGVGVPMLFLFLIALLFRYRRRPAGPSEEELFRQIEELSQAQEEEQARREISQQTEAEPEAPPEPEKKPWEDDSFWDT